MTARLALALVAELMVFADDDAVPPTLACCALEMEVLELVALAINA